MRLTAIATGYAVPFINFDATIHSVFRTALNLRPANQDLLLTLVVANEADLPQGIRIDSPVDFTFEPLRISRRVLCLDNTLIFENLNLAVEFNQSRCWQCDLPAMNTKLTNPAVAEAWKSVWKLLNERQVCLGAEIVAQELLQSDGLTHSAVSRRIGKAIRTLIEITRKYQLDDLSTLNRLIGLGTGLTPCGDDFLVGYLAGLWCTVRDSAERRQFVSKLGQAVIHLSGKTNDISRTYLHHAANGQVSSRLNTLARAIGNQESPGQLLVAADAALHSGHTSGMDAVTGLLLGLAAWEGETILALC
jgi:hypothetical protein